MKCEICGSELMKLSTGMKCLACDKEYELEIIPELSENASSLEVLDFMAITLLREITANVAFKGGWMLNKLLSNSRLTQDVDLSVCKVGDYESAKVALRNLGELFIEKGLIDRYEIKETITETSSGGVSMYSKSGEKVFGVDIGLHNIDYGIRHYDINITELDAFSPERMLGDKISAILSRKRFRRVKDLYDFNAIVNTFDININELKSCVEKREPAWENIPFSDEVVIQYAKAWDKLKLVKSSYNKTQNNEQLLEKPNFSTVLHLFTTFCMPIKNNMKDLTWNHNKQVWESEEDGLRKVKF